MDDGDCRVIAAVVDCTWEIVATVCEGVSLGKDR